MSSSSQGITFHSFFPFLNKEPVFIYLSPQGHRNGAAVRQVSKKQTKTNKVWNDGPAGLDCDQGGLSQLGSVCKLLSLNK